MRYLALLFLLCTAAFGGNKEPEKGWTPTLVDAVVNSADQIEGLEDLPIKAPTRRMIRQAVRPLAKRNNMSMKLASELYKSKWLKGLEQGKSALKWTGEVLRGVNKVQNTVKVISGLYEGGLKGGLKEGKDIILSDFAATGGAAAGAFLGASLGPKGSLIGAVGGAIGGSLLYSEIIAPGIDYIYFPTKEQLEEERLRHLAELERQIDWEWVSSVNRRKNPVVTPPEREQSRRFDETTTWWPTTGDDYAFALTDGGTTTAGTQKPIKATKKPGSGSREPGTTSEITKLGMKIGEQLVRGNGKASSATPSSSSKATRTTPPGPMKLILRGPDLVAADFPGSSYFRACLTAGEGERDVSSKAAWVIQRGPQVGETQDFYVYVKYDGQIAKMTVSWHRSRQHSRRKPSFNKWKLGGKPAPKVARIIW